MRVVNQARAYLKKVPGAVEGNEGDRLTYIVACTLVKGFGLDRVNALLLFEEWNKKCKPPWSRKDLEKKLENADQYGQDKPKKKKKSAEFGVDPLPLFTELKEPEPFPFDSLGPILKPFAKRLFEIVKAPDSVCGQSVLAAANLAAQGFADVEIPNIQCPLSLYFCSICLSGDRKTAVDKLATKPIREFEEELRIQFGEKLKEYEIALDLYKEAKKSIMSKPRNKKDELSDEEKKQKLMDLEEPKKPWNPTVLLQEPTYEALIKNFMHGRPSLGLFSDEGGQFLGGHAMNKENAVKTAAGLSSLWDGGPINRSRASEDTITMNGKRLCLHLMLQPSVFLETASGSLLWGQGFLNRLLFVKPNSLVGSRAYMKDNIFHTEEYSKYDRTLSRLLREQFTVGKIPNELNPRILELSAPALNKWQDFYNEIEVKSKKGNEYESISEYASKSGTLALRIAGTLQIVENIDSAMVSGKNVDHAIKLVKFYLHEAQRLKDSNFFDTDVIDADQLLKWMQSREESYLPMQLILQKGPKAFRNKKRMSQLLSILEEHGWIQQVGPMEIEGTHRQEVWEATK